MNKICRDCGVDKPVDDFYKHPTGTLGRGPYCKECTKLRAKKSAQLDRMLGIPKAITANGLERKRQYQREYRKTHREQIAVAARPLNAARRLLVKERSDGSVTKAFMEVLYAQTSCAYCRAFVPRQDRTSDHAIPLTRGGLHSVRNLAMACRPCNSRKGDQTDVEFCGRSVVVALEVFEC